ncbi:hypothetical protein N1031_12985 [Herbiconiux moechotypicola]|uniref:Lipoprotein n=1 Tax=Herbiconiux moechotypicola TaxID=637393 RepID=A0ABP5QR01_9MICO|nr:hypothetical protein [Herbiconiux moechotypicola]MCS5730679.1 hypothetical protein [Herbiconiux moechotypicola]
MKMRKLLPVTAVAAFALALAGCTVTGPTENFSGFPDEERLVHEIEGGDEAVQAFWMQEGSQLGIAISGSSTCPVIGSDIKVIEEAGEGNTVEITTVPIPENQICTMDYVPHTSVFWTPAKVSTAEPLTIRVQGEEITLATK